MTRTSYTELDMARLEESPPAALVSENHDAQHTVTQRVKFHVSSWMYAQRRAWLEVIGASMCRN